MNIVEVIDKKRLNKKLSKKEINWLIDAYMKEEVKDYQMSAFLMAVTLNGLSDSETLFLTEALIKSGKKMNYKNQLLVDKHSTGGVGDKTTLLIAPIIAAVGLKMVKMSGRGLGFTGGTIDKLESIGGFQTELNQEKVKKALKEVGICLLSNQNEITPADKKLYQLRDVTATTDSIPLIASSIMSKKIASGAKVLVIDLKVGHGAFIKNKKDALELARLIKLIGKRYQIKTTCVISRMNEPIGYCVGNGLEVKECLNFLNGKYEASLYELVITLSSVLISDGLNISRKKALTEVKKVIENKQALNKFKQMIKFQKGDLSKIEISIKKQAIPSPNQGYLSSIDAYKIGQLVRQLGGGRYQKEDTIDYGVGIEFQKKVGDYVNKGDELLIVYYNHKDASILEILNCFKFSQSVKKMKIVEKIL